MLETIRELAVERLEASGEAEELRARHTAHYLELARAGVRGLASAEQPAWLARLELDADNFRAVLRRAVRRGDAETMVRLGELLVFPWEMHGAYAEGRAWMEQVGRMANCSPIDRIIARQIELYMAFWQGDVDAFPPSMDVDDEEILKSAGARRELAQLYLLRALMVHAEREPSRARDDIAEAIAIADEVSEPLFAGRVYLAGAYLGRMQGELADARTLATKAIELAERTGDLYLRTITVLLLASLSLLQNDPGETRRLADEAIRGSRVLNNRGTAAFALDIGAGAAVQVGDAELGARLFGTAKRLRQAVGTRVWPAEVGVHRTIEAALRQALGDAYDRAHAEGERWSLDEAVRALSGDGGSPAQHMLAAGASSIGNR
jgi:tetratricopeptide (TPR) repeat protein